MNIQPPLLSVIVPFYNNEAFIIAALDSLFTQISDDIEVVIIDDGSTDASGALVSRYLAQRQHLRSAILRSISTMLSSKLSSTTRCAPSSLN